MNNTRIRTTERQRSRHHNRLLAAAAAVLVVAAGVAIASAASGGSPDPTYARTGEINAMGMPVIETPGTASGTAAVNGITATPSTWALGRVPLNVAVRPTWTIQNDATDEVTIGEPHAQVNEGCCPGAFTLQGSDTLTPGSEAELTFELSMHPGMDGAHDMTVHVPIQRADGTTDTLTLNVAGNFRD